jgi:hypothetical protein
LLHAKLDLVDNICIICDCGTHFRSKVVLVSWAGVLMQEFKKDSTWHFLTEQHGKGEVDGYFATLNHWVQQSLALGDLNDCDDVVEAWRHHAADEVRVLDLPEPRHRFTNFKPPPRSAIKIMQFTNKSFDVPITGCHSWSWTILDKRRLSFRGAGLDVNTLTGLSMKALLLPGFRAVAERTTRPVVAFEGFVPDIVVAATDDDDEDDRDLDDEPREATRISDGWRIAYRLDQQEKIVPAKQRARLERKHKSLKPLLDRLPQGARRASLEAMAARALLSTQTRATRSKLWTMGMQRLCGAAIA